VRGGAVSTSRAWLILSEQNLAVQLDRAEFGMDKGFVVLEASGYLVPPVQDPQQRGSDMHRGSCRRRGVVPGYPEQVVALVAGQPQCTGERGEHLLAGLRAAPRCCSSRVQ
jgi:hypothetical protein